LIGPLNILGMKTATFCHFQKTDDERQIVYAEVYVPMVPDSQGDFMIASEIERIAHDFMKNGNVNRIDVNHSLEESGSYVIESFVARKDDPDFVFQAWVMGVHIPDPNIWAMVKDGRLNGFSMYGHGIRVERTIELEIPDSGVIKGATEHDRDQGTGSHYHEFTVKFDVTGKFLGGETGSAIGSGDQHVHSVHKGTATEQSSGHSHRFSFVESVNANQVDSE